MGGIVNSVGINLSCIFGSRAQNEVQLSVEILENKIFGTDFKERIVREAGAYVWPQAIEEVSRKVPEILDVSLPEIIVSAWNKYRLLAKCCDPDKYSPDEVFLVPLIDHTITSEHKPHIDVLLGERPFFRIDFIIDISLMLNGFIARVQGGRLKEIRTGLCKASGSIKCDGFMLAERESAPLELPGSIDFGDGVPISL
ncbi:MAG TPA: hypothetical protein VMB78_05660 [Dissulfurispiraceae bacterium]|nr:hypothetical protein [Dissulfurispiraceae bacterium]